MTKHWPNTFTVLEDQPKSDRWDVEIKTFPSRDAAERYLKRHYAAEERNGECNICRPFVRNDNDVECV